MTIVCCPRSDGGVAPVGRRRPRTEGTSCLRAVTMGVFAVLALALPGGSAAAQQANQAPVAATTGPYETTSLGLYLDGTPSRDPDGDALTYRWDFGDGTTGTYTRTPVWHRYAARGTYTVTLVVTDARGAASAPVTTTVTIHNDPVAVPGTSYRGVEGSPIRLDGSGSYDPDGEPLTYFWEFGDGTTGTGVQPTHTYAQSAKYTIYLTVTDSRGASNRKYVSATIANVAPTVSARLSASSVAAGSAVTLTGSFTDPSAVDGPWAYTVVWGDGSANTTGSVTSTSSTISATHTYTAVGSYAVTLQVADRDTAQGSARATLTVTTSPTQTNRAPVAAAGGPYSAAEGAAVQLDGRSSSDPDGDALTYAWDFGDGTTGTGAQPTHVYARSGSYTATLTVTDTRDASSAPATAAVTIANVAPTVSATLSASSVAVGSAVTLTGSFTDPSAVDGPWAYTVVWGDGSANTTGSVTSTGSTISATHTYATVGSYTVTLQVRDGDGGQGSAQRALTVSTVPTTSTVVLLAGDIADCNRGEDELTARILDRHPDATVLTLGDNVYPYGTLTTFRSCYEPSWGRHKARTWPAVGNHEYTSNMPNAEGYHSYFGTRAGPVGKAYYTTTMGDWQIFVLNSEISMRAGSAQEVWLRSELAKSTKRCQLAVWHKPRYYSGTLSYERTTQKAVWVALYQAGVELAFAGHQHSYERFAPQNADGVADATRGIRQIIVGTGGKDPASFGTPAPNSQVREAEAFGVLKLTLGSGDYRWEFLPAEQTSFTDSGSGTCH